jgi:small-conductance mechanosensitive channel
MIGLMATAFLLLVCATSVATGDDGRVPDPDAKTQTARLAELTAAVDRDRERLKQLVSQERAAEPSLEESPELREIAARLPALQAELRELRQRIGATSP